MQEYDVYYTNGRPYPNTFNSWEGKVSAENEKRAVEIVANSKVVKETPVGSRTQYTTERGTHYMVSIHKEFAG